MQDGGAGEGSADRRRRQIVGFPYLKALGYNLGSAGPSLLGGPTGFGYPGAGGNLGYAEPEFGFAIAVAKNRMTQAWPTALEAEVREALGLPPVPSLACREPVGSNICLSSPTLASTGQ